MAQGRKTGGGSRKGKSNRITGAVRDMVVQALDRAGGVDYLAEQAEKNPAAFMTLLGKALPLNVGGGNDGPIQVQWIVDTGVKRHVDVDPS